MIVSHRHKFIFLKTRKTAGTSIEIALSEHCGPQDLITTITDTDEAIRRDLGFRGPQKWRRPLWRYNWRHMKLAWSWRRPVPLFYNHYPAAEAKKELGSTVWDAYYKFSIERNPFDRAISLYFWETRDKDPRPPMAEYFAQAPLAHLSNRYIYSIGDKIAADFIIRYERLQEDLAAVYQQLGLPGEPHLPNAKGGHRKERRHYSEVLDSESREIIESACAKEIEELGYRWETPAGELES